MVNNLASLDAGTLWTVAGTILTVAFGIIGVYYALRIRYPGQLTCILADAVTLLHYTEDGPGHITVSYDGNPISSNLYSCRLLLLNTGRQDLEFKSHPLVMTLPLGAFWLASEVGGFSPDVVAGVSKDESNLIITADLLRRNEYVEIEMLLGIPPEIRDQTPRNATRALIANLISIKHRIPNTEAIKIIYQVPEAPKPLYFVRRIAVTFLLPIVLSVLSFWGTTHSDPQLIFCDTSACYEVTGKKEDRVELRQVGGQQKKVLTVAEFNSLGTDLKLRQQPLELSVLYLALGLFGMSLLMDFLDYLEKRVGLKIAKIYKRP